MSWETTLRRRERDEREERERLQRRRALREQEAQAETARQAEEARRLPFRAWASFMGEPDPYAWEQAAARRAEPVKTPLDNLRDALRDHARRGEPLMSEARRWRPDPRNPGHSLSGSDLDEYPEAYRTRKLKEAQSALNLHDAEAMRVINPLIAAAELEPSHKFQLGTRLQAAETGEVSLLTDQYRDLTRQQQAELNSHGLAAAERGDLTSALQHKRAAEVLHVGTPELDQALMSADPARVEGRAQLDKLGSLVEAAQMDTARRHVRAGVANDTENIVHMTWAQQNGHDPENAGSYVEAELSKAE